MRPSASKSSCMQDTLCLTAQTTNRLVARRARRSGGWRACAGWVPTWTAMPTSVTAQTSRSTPTTITAGAPRRSRRRPTRDSAHGDDAARKPWQSLSMSSATVYWRPGCPFCLKLRLGLRLTRTPHQLVNVREDPEASAFVKRHNGGNEVVPTVAVGDRVLNNPSVREIQRALADL